MTVKNDYESNPNFRAMKAHRAALMRNDGRAAYWFPKPVENKAHARKILTHPNNPSTWRGKLDAMARHESAEHLYTHLQPKGLPDARHIHAMPDGPEKTAAYVVWFCLANNLTL